MRSVASLCLLFPVGTSGQDIFLAAPAPGPRVHSTGELQDPNISSDVFDPLRKLLSGWEFTTEYAIAIGNAKHGNVFTYESGNFTMHTSVPTGSTSKWPSAMMFAGLVDDGTISSFDDPVNKYVKWWTKDPTDKRSLITYRMLLDFTSGFGDGHPGEEFNNRAAREWRQKHSMQRVPHSFQERLALAIGAEDAAACNEKTGNIPDCAKSIYGNVKIIGTPGKVYSYNSNHLQLAAAVAVAASGLPIHRLIEKYLLKPYGMEESFYFGNCPSFAGDLVTTAADYEKFMRNLLGYKTLSKATMDESEKDATPFLEGYTLYGDYGFGHFLMCFDSVMGMTEACKQDKVHLDPGAFGFIPFYSRKYDYYMEVVAAETGSTGSYPLSGIPEYLAVALKPHVDAIFAGRSPSAGAQLTHSPDFLTLGVADVNYCLNCKLHPDRCQ